jgi:hypothetical protein
MGKRKVFYDEKGTELSVYPIISGHLFIGVETEEGVKTELTLTKEDAFDLIMELYRIKKAWPE